MTAASDLGLIEIHRGFYDREVFGEKSSSGRGRATRIRPLGKFLKLAVGLGISPENIDQNFHEHPPTRVLVLKAPSTRAGHIKSKGRPMRFAASSVSARLEKEVREINTFWTTIELSGAIHRGFRRVFNEGKKEGYDWDRGGRLYSIGEDNYQLLKKQQRAAIRINGEPVIELDIRASHLTILHGIFGVPMVPSKDPYEVNGVPRGVVKAWVTMALGKGDVPKRWSPAHIEDMRELGIELSRDYPLKKITPVILGALPVLRKWERQKLSSLELMYYESQAIIRTVLTLIRKHQIPSLPVHDSLIVQRRHATSCKQLIVEHYEQICGMTPAVHEGE